MDDTQRIVKCGSLSLHSSSGFFKRWQPKYLVLYDGSKSGIKRLELFDSEIKFKKQIPAKIIPLLECIRVVTCQRQKTTYTFEVRTNEQFYLLAAQSFQDMNDWVNCLRLVAFGSEAPGAARQRAAGSPNRRAPAAAANHLSKGAGVDVLLEKRGGQRRQAETGELLPPSVPTDTHPALKAAKEARTSATGSGPPTTASQAAAAAASAFAKTRQRQPSLLGAVKPQPPADSPFILGAAPGDVKKPVAKGALVESAAARPTTLQGLDEEEENMLYCSIEDNPSEHNYRVKVIETDLSLRCQLKCYQLSGPTTISQQYEQLARFQQSAAPAPPAALEPAVTFYQLLVGPQELVLLNDYASTVRHQQQHLSQVGLNRLQHQQQGLWSWPYQCIRRYGFDKDNCFMFEAGRKCTSGPGQFVVQTPKAYNIYQDVVAFVNKLRSSGVNAPGPLTLEPVPEASQQAEAQEQQVSGAESPTVTQIPVAWAPLMCATAEQQNGAPPVSSRKQFFSTLQQQQPTCQKELSPRTAELTVSVSPTSSASSCDATQTTSSSSSSTAPQDKAVDKAAADKSGTSETDESGYEHGDESVDSNKWPARQRAQPNPVGPHLNTRKRQPSAECMSSASSTSSGGSPGHSVSRRTNAVSGQAPAAKGRPQLMLTDRSINGEPSELVEEKRRAPVRLGAILDSLARDNSDDFEANLIRDVYSEINKLHAKFAVASGSVEDSMSSHSSNDGSGEQEQEQENNLSRAPQVSRLQARDSAAAVYSNLNRAFSRSKSADLNLSDDFDDTSNLAQPLRNLVRQNYKSAATQLNRSQQYSNNLQQQQFDQYKAPAAAAAYCGGPMYPTILNPIPECGEPTVQHPLKSPRGIRRQSSNLSQQSAAKQVYSAVGGEMMRPAPVRNPRLAKPQSCSGQAGDTTSSTPRGSSMVPKLPTKHYVINDVQYAKISRNVGSKIESCL